MSSYNALLKLEDVTLTEIRKTRKREKPPYDSKIQNHNLVFCKKNNDNDDGILIFQLEINIDNLKVAS